MIYSRALRLDHDVARHTCHTFSYPIPKEAFEEKLKQSSDQQGHCQAALKQGSDRQTTSSRLQLERSCIMCKKTCRRTYVFRTPDGGFYEL